MNKYRILKTWDDQKADWTYSLQIDSGQGDGWQETVYHGDADWATRQSEYYECEIVEEEKPTEA